jgi:hypothetical protein
MPAKAPRCGGIIRYLLWAYSFKFGIFFVVIGTALRTAIPSKRLWLFTIGGLIYIMAAYIPLPAYSIVFGIGGGVMTVLIVFIIQRWAEERRHLLDHEKTATDYRMIGYFFFAMATYNLCPLMGVKAFALHPEKMIRYHRQADAASFATHILIELVLGWVCLFLSYRQRRHSIVNSEVTA